MTSLHFFLLLLPSLSDGALVHSGTPPGVPSSFDCAIREAAWAYGKRLLPARGTFRSLYDALQLGLCDGAPQPAEHDVWAPPTDPLPANEPVLLVDLDAKLAPTLKTFTSVHDAVEASRALRRGGARNVTIALRSGVHHLPTTLHLGPADSGLTLRSYPGERAVLSAGVALSTKWKASKACPNMPTGCWEASLAGQVRSMSGLRLHGRREIRSRFPNFDPEFDRRERSGCRRGGRGGRV